MINCLLKNFWSLIQKSDLETKIDKDSSKFQNPNVKYNSYFVIRTSRSFYSWMLPANEILNFLEALQHTESDCETNDVEFVVRWLIAKPLVDFLQLVEVKLMEKNLMGVHRLSHALLSTICARNNGILDESK